MTLSVLVSAFVILPASRAVYHRTPLLKRSEKAFHRRSCRMPRSRVRRRPRPRKRSLARVFSLGVFVFACPSSRRGRRRSTTASPPQGSRVRPGEPVRSRFPSRRAGRRCWTAGGPSPSSSRGSWLAPSACGAPFDRFERLFGSRRYGRRPSRHRKRHPSA